MQCMMAQLTRKNVKGLQVKRLSWASGDLSTSATTRGIQICHEDVDLWSQRGSGLIMFSPKPMDFRPLSLVELGLIQVELTVSIPKRPLWIGSVGNQWESCQNALKHRLTISNIKTWNAIYIVQQFILKSVFFLQRALGTKSMLEFYTGLVKISHIMIWISKKSSLRKCQSVAPIPKWILPKSCYVFTMKQHFDTINLLAFLNFFGGIWWPIFRCLTGKKKKRLHHL